MHILITALRRFGWVLLVVLAFYLIFSTMTKMPGKSYAAPMPALNPEEQVLRQNLEQHVKKFGWEIGERNQQKNQQLWQAEQYIVKTWKELGFQVGTQIYLSGTFMVRNLEIQLDGQSSKNEILIVGAHYDSVMGSPGANDNGSGVAALLELARYFHGKQFARSLRLVAFVNEEPPYFATENMGSYRYAQRCYENREKIIGMLSLESLGYYSDEPESQLYPFPFRLFYPDTANFIGFVGNWSSRKLLRQAISTFRQTAAIPSEGLIAPGWISGVGWSDHAAFWKFGYPAIMLTDTALFRDPYYHTPDDTPNHLHYDNMTRVVAGVAKVIEKLLQ